MPALSFQSRFADLVRSGEKKQTIRSPHKRRPIRVGDTLYLYKNQRSKDNELLSTTKCLSLETIRIVRRSGLEINDSVFLSGGLLTFDQAKDLAFADGFDTLQEFFDYFIPIRSERYYSPFDGVLIKWDKFL